MLSKTISRIALYIVLVVFVFAAWLSSTASSPAASGPATFGQATSGQTMPGTAKPPVPGSAAGLEFPVFMRQSVVAGATPVGTKVQAKLAVATLVNGVVVPEGAILSGEVTESVAKSATSPSRLAIRMDSAQWKNRSEPLVLAPKLYLTAWYYPAALSSNQELSDGLPDAGNNPRIRMGGTYPGQRNPTAPPIPGAGTGVDTNPSPDSDSSKHRVLMKNVESVSDGGETVTLTSKFSNIKLDKTTSYVFAAGSLARGPG